MTTNLPMQFRWRGISGSAIAARTAFVDREAEPTILQAQELSDLERARFASVYDTLDHETVSEPTVIALPAPAPAVKAVKTVKAAPESLSFAVAAERPVRGDRKRFRYTTAQAAETVARRIVTGRGGEMSLWLYDGENRPVEIAVVLRDALDRVWTQVTARPDQRSYL